MIPQDCRYTTEHEWVRPDGPEHVKIGITDFAQGALGDIVFVELPAVGTKLAQMQPFGSVEAVKAVSDLFSPVAGEVVEVNAALKGDPATSIAPTRRGG
jgi:glycine cleavage system H protein